MNSFAHLFSITILLAILVFDGFIGWLLAKGRGRGTAGFWLGFCLSWIGWIVAAGLRESPAHYEAKYGPSRPDTEAGYQQWFVENYPSGNSTKR